MPVERHSFVKKIEDLDLKNVAWSGLDRGARELICFRQALFQVSI